MPPSGEVMSIDVLTLRNFESSVDLYPGEASTR